MLFDPDDLYDRRVVAFADRWESDLDEFPDRAGVYVFATQAFHVRYVGKAGPGRLRTEAKAALRRGKADGAHLAVWLATNSDEKAWSLERDLIVKYAPFNNIARPNQRRWR